MKLIPNVISNMLIILALKMRWKKVLNNAETNIFRWDMLFLAVPAGSVLRCFVTYSEHGQVFDFSKDEFYSLEGRRLLQTTKKRLTHPTTCHVCVDIRFTWKQVPESMLHRESVSP